MKNLSHIAESLLDNTQSGVLSQIRKWMNSHTELHEGIGRPFTYSINDDLSIDVHDCNLVFKQQTFSEFPEYIQFNSVDYGLLISDCDNLHSTKGFPKILGAKKNGSGGSITINNTDLHDLDWWPKIIERDPSKFTISMSYCNRLSKCSVKIKCPKGSLFITYNGLRKNADSFIEDLKKNVTMQQIKVRIIEAGGKINTIYEKS